MYHLKPKNHIDGSNSVLLIFFSEHLGYTCSAANKGRSRVNYRQSLAFDLLYLSRNNHCDWWLFQENFFYYYFQKQPYADILQNRCCKKFWNSRRKTSVLKSLFFLLTACNFTSNPSQRRLQHRWLQQSENCEIVTALRPAALFQPRPKRDFNTGDFRRMKIAKFLWTAFFMEHLRRLLLSVW